MRALYKEIETDLDHVFIIPLSDLHLGDPNFDEEKLNGYLEWILERENAYVFLNGDIFDCAIIGSKSNPFEAVMTVSEAKRKAKELLIPIKDRVLGITMGNHERRIWKTTGNDVSEDLAMILGLEDIYGQKGIVINLNINNNVNYDIYVKHGTGGGKTQAYRLKKLKECADIVKNADLYIIGHVHDILTFSINPLFINPDRGLYNRKQTFVASSSYLKYGGYAEDLDFEPAKTGSPRIRLNAIRKDVHVSI